MATLYITEYAGLAAAFPGASQAQSNMQTPQEPPLAEQTITIAAGSAQSAAFNAKTYLIRVHTDAICSVLVGANPVATAASGRMAANQTENRGVSPGQKIAVITNT